MAPPLFLNATCVAEETLNFAFIDTTTFDETTCAIAPPGSANWWTSTRIVAFVFISLFVIFLAWGMSSAITISSLVEQLRGLPSEELHQTIENMAERGLTGSNKRKFDRYESERFKSVTTTTDEAAKTKTVTLVEDLTRKPLTSFQRAKTPKVPKDSKTVKGGDLEACAPPARACGNLQPSSHGAPGTLQSDIPLTGAGLTASVSQGQARTGSGEERAEMDIGTAPPPYKWTNFV